MRKEVYNEIQKVLLCVDFITTIKECKQQNLPKIEAFKTNIRNIDKMNYESSFKLSLDI